MFLVEVSRVEIGDYLAIVTLDNELYILDLSGGHREPVFTMKSKETDWSLIM